MTSEKELEYLYGLFENITRIDYMPLEQREEVKQLLIDAYKDGNSIFEKIKQDLEELRELKEGKIEKFKLTEFEKTILEYLESRYKYIARDESGALYIYENKPSKGDDKYYVEYGHYDRLVFDDLFNFIKWEDDEPTLIEDLLK